MTTEEFFADINWVVLRDQKAKLIEVITFAEEQYDIFGDVEILDGLVNLIDHIQDHAVDDLGIPAEDVFLTDED